MNKIKLFLVGMLAVVLVGCGGHDYEGTWKMEAGAMGFNMGLGQFIIGSDYIEKEGKRDPMDFEVRETNGVKYLVMSDPKTNEEFGSFKIIDANTLSQKTGLGSSVKLIRVQETEKQ